MSKLRMDNRKVLYLELDKKLLLVAAILRIVVAITQFNMCCLLILNRDFILV